jgi:hypothetical protein
MTVAHVFEPPNFSIENNISQADGQGEDFEFDDDDNTADEESDSDEVEFNSGLSASSIPSPTRPTGSFMSHIQAAEVGRRAPETISLNHENCSGDTSFASQSDSVLFISSARDYYWQESVVLKYPPLSISNEEGLSLEVHAFHEKGLQDDASFSGRDLKLDWALIKLPCSGGQTLSLRPLIIGPNVSKISPVFITRGARRIHGSISQVSTMIKLSTQTKFLEVWSVYLESDLRK